MRLQAKSENFPVALRVLPRPLRVDLLAVYGFARLADDIGDRYDGDRLAALDWLEHDLDLAASGQASHPAVHALTPPSSTCTSGCPKNSRNQNARAARVPDVSS